MLGSADCCSLPHRPFTAAMDSFLIRHGIAAADLQTVGWRRFAYAGLFALVGTSIGLLMAALLNVGARLL